jgi:hypothetical protein
MKWLRTYYPRWFRYSVGETRGERVEPEVKGSTVKQARRQWLPPEPRNSMSIDDAKPKLDESDRCFSFFRGKQFGVRHVLKIPGSRLMQRPTFERWTAGCKSE